MKTEKTLIDRLLENAEETIKVVKRPFVKSKIKRSFASAIESAKEQSLDADIKINDLRERLVKNPEDACSILNDIIKQRDLMQKIDNTIKYLSEEEKTWFGK